MPMDYSSMSLNKYDLSDNMPQNNMLKPSGRTGLQVILSGRGYDEEFMPRQDYSSEEDENKEIRDKLELPKRPGTHLFKYRRNRFIENPSEIGEIKPSSIILFDTLATSDHQKVKKKACKEACCKKKDALIDSNSEDDLDHLEDALVVQCFEIERDNQRECKERHHIKHVGNHVPNLLVL